MSSDPVAYDRFYNLIANPLLWFIQHYLWDLSNVPDFRQIERQAWTDGYKRVNEDLARAALEEIADLESPILMVHDYHLYTCPALIRRERPDVFLHHFVHIPWTHPDAWRVLPEDVRREIFEGLLSNDIVGFHTQLLLPQLPPVLPPADGPANGFRAIRRDLPRRPRDLGAALPARDRLRRRSRRSPRAKGWRATRPRSCGGGATT